MTTHGCRSLQNSSISLVRDGRSVCRAVRRYAELAALVTRGAGVRQVRQVVYRPANRFQPSRSSTATPAVVRTDCDRRYRRYRRAASLVRPRGQDTVPGACNSTQSMSLESKSHEPTVCERAGAWSKGRHVLTRSRHGELCATRTWCRPGPTGGSTGAQVRPPRRSGRPGAAAGWRTPCGVGSPDRGLRTVTGAG